MPEPDMQTKCPECGHLALHHHGVDPVDGCLAQSRLYPCPCSLTATEAATR